MRRQIQADLAGRGYPSGNLRIDVTGRTVTVHGQVATADDKQEVLRIVRQVPGVLDLHDGLVINAPAKARPQRRDSVEAGLPVWAIATIVGTVAAGVISIVLIILLRPAPRVEGAIETRAPVRPAIVEGPAPAPVPAAIPAPAPAPAADPWKKPRIVVDPATVSHSPVPVYPTVGKLEFKRAPPTGAFIVLHPVDAPLPRNARPFAVVRADGTFRISTYGRDDGAPAGEYVITVEWRKLVGGGVDSISGPNLLPARFAKPDTSGLHVTISAGKNEIPPLELPE